LIGVETADWGWGCRLQVGGCRATFGSNRFESVQSGAIWCNPVQLERGRGERGRRPRGKLMSSLASGLAVWPDVVGRSFIFVVGRLGGLCGPAAAEGLKRTAPLYSTDVQKGDFPAGRRNFVGNIFMVVRNLARDRRDGESSVSEQPSNEATKEKRLG
jgi:hypothetical protein